MLTRRMTVLGTLAAAKLAAGSGASAQASPASADEPYELIFPPLSALDPTRDFGYKEPTHFQREKADSIISLTPKGPLPVDIAQSFVDRFYEKDPEAISQWPAPMAWNPLVVAFFDATYDAPSTRVTDMIPWCAAFANWCIERGGRSGSRSVSSQSFLDSGRMRTNTPKRGDLAVFTCYDAATGDRLRLGHVAFFKEEMADGRIRVIGGNQSGDGHRSIISETGMPTGDMPIRRRVNDGYVRTVMRLSAYVSLG